MLRYTYLLYDEWAEKTVARWLRMARKRRRDLWQNLVARRRTSSKSLTVAGARSRLTENWSAKNAAVFVIDLLGRACNENAKQKTTVCIA